MTRNTTSDQAPCFIGIDYSKVFSVVTIGDHTGSVISQEKLINDEAAMREYFRTFRGLPCAIESCRGYEWLVQLLRDVGCQVHLANPYGVKLIAQSRCKTDKIDSRILMELLAKGFLPTCYQVTQKESDYRELVRHRAQLVRTKVRHKQRVHALLDKENKGLRYPFTEAGRKQVAQITLLGERQALLEHELNVIDFVEEKVTYLDQRIRRLAKSDPDVYRLKSIPGFDVYTAMLFRAEIGDCTRFIRSKQVVAYIGLAPRVYESGSVRRTGRITKQGSPLLRSALVESAWSAIRCSPTLLKRFNRIAVKRGRKVAIVAVAAQLARIAYRVLRSREKFSEEKLALG